MPKKSKLSDEQREVARQIGKLGGRPIENKTEKAKKNRERVAAWREKRRKENE